MIFAIAPRLPSIDVSVMSGITTILPIAVAGRPAA